MASQDVATHPGKRSSTHSRLTTASSNAGDHTCHRCKKPIRTAQFIRVGDYHFHVKHFCCWECRTPLHGKNFHHRKDKFYCAEDYKRKYLKKCRKCNETILAGHVVQAFGGYYHPEHFVCTVCSQVFEKGKYFELENAPYCETCYMDLTAPKCEYCHKPIADVDKVPIGQKNYHANCLKCTHCGKTLGLGNEQVFQKDNFMYCRKDYLDFFSRRCTKCGDHILKQCISVNDEYYHPNCLRCAHCNMKLKSYICALGQLRCKDHAETALEPLPCDHCGGALDEEYVESGGTIMLAAGRACHLEHFNCSFCSKPLEKGKCKLRDDMLCCVDCLFTAPPLDVKRKSAVHKRPAQDPPSSSSSPPNGQRYEFVPRTKSTSDAKQQPSPVAVNKPPPPSNAGVSDNNLDDPPPVEPQSPAPSSNTLHSTPASPKARPASSSDSPAAGSSSRRRVAKRTASSTSSFSTKSDEKLDWKKGELIGKGAFGKVFMGMVKKTGGLIAVKQVPVQSAEDEELAATITNEINLMKKLHHPNIVNMIETQRLGSKLFILMEYVPGNSLDTMLEKFGPFSEDVLKSYTQQLLSALAYCHAHKVVHRDIKGKNILVDIHSHVKLCDFGSAKQLMNMTKQAPSLTYNYTPLWTAPEVLNGVYNSKVDVWSLGCVVIEMATAAAPWADKEFENPFRALYHIGNSDEIPTIPDNLSDVAKDFLRLALTRDPEKRPEAAELLKHEWLADLDSN